MFNKNILACFSIFSTVIFLGNAAFTSANFTSKENKVGNSVNSVQTGIQKEPWISWSKVADVPYKLKELVNDAVWHNNAGHIAERDLLRAEAEKYLKKNDLEDDYYLP